MLYDVILTLKTGEIKHLSHIALISWTRSRVIFSDNADQSVFYVAGMISECKMSREVESE